MDEILHKLEMRLRALVQKQDELNKTNAQLRQARTLLLREKEMLTAKNKIAISQIESMVARLKSIENLS